MEKQIIDPQAIGKIKWFSPHKGFGFLTMPDGRDVFVHISGLRNQDKYPIEGTPVTFRLYKGSNGLFARNVEVVG
jgi:cold shock protein